MTYTIDFTKFKTQVISLMLIILSLYFFIGCSINHLQEYSFTIGQEVDWKKLSLSGKEKNFSAFNQELLRKVEIQEDLHFKLIPTHQGIEDLRENKLQALLTSVQPSFIYKDLLFSDPYFLFGPVLIVQQHPKNEHGKNIIGLPENSPLLMTLEKDSRIETKIFDDILSAFSELRKGHIDGAIFPAIPAYIYTETFYKHELKVASPPLTNQGIHLVVLNNKQGEALITKFNEALKKLMQNGDYQKMLANWDLIDVNASQ